MRAWLCGGTRDSPGALPVFTGGSGNGFSESNLAICIVGEGGKPPERIPPLLTFFSFQGWTSSQIIKLTQTRLTGEKAI